eukprot:SM000243S08601  [mRNA]  locus=s243:52305:54330:- [translate_table: standard]
MTWWAHAVASVRRWAGRSSLSPHSPLLVPSFRARHPQRPAGEPGLVGTRLACMRGGAVVLRGVSFSLHAGGGLVLTGPNGSGKSSLLRMLAGFIRPSAGRVLWDGHDVTRGTVADVYRTQLHLVAAKDAIKPALTVDQNVRFWAELEGTAERTKGALDRVGLGPYAVQRADVLSLGQKKRLQLARMLAMPRPLWLLDEPSVGLDKQGLKLLETMIAEHQLQGGLVLIATHSHISVPGAMQLHLPARVHDSNDLLD